MVYLRGYYQRIVTPAMANENRGFVTETCKFRGNIRFGKYENRTLGNKRKNRNTMENVIAHGRFKPSFPISQETECNNKINDMIA